MLEKRAVWDIESDEGAASDNKKRMESERVEQRKDKLELSEAIENEQGEVAGRMEEN